MITTCYAVKAQTHRRCGRGQCRSGHAWRPDCGDGFSVPSAWQGDNTPFGVASLTQDAFLGADPAQCSPNGLYVTSKDVTLTQPAMLCTACYRPTSGAGRGNPLHLIRVPTPTERGSAGWLTGMLPTNAACLNDYRDISAAVGFPKGSDYS